MALPVASPRPVLAAFVLRRLLWSVPLLLGVMLLTFAVMRGAGGSPFRNEFGNLPLSLQVQLTSFYRLEEPWPVEFLTYVRHVVTLEFGPALTARVTVDQVVEEGFRTSLELALLASAVAVPLALYLGLTAAWHRGGVLDAVLTTVATLLLVAPVFLVAGLASEYLTLRWSVLPRGWDSWAGRVAPTLAMAMAPAGYGARLIRAAAVETLEQDYVRTARAKGLRGPRIRRAHVLRNSMVPFLAAAAPTMALLVTGAFFVEAAFDVPGASSWFVDSAKRRDYPMVMGLTVALAIVVIAVNLVADVIAAALDPRLRERA